MTTENEATGNAVTENMTTGNVTTENRTTGNAVTGKNLVILGSTGSIGTQTLEVVRAYPQFRVLGLAAGKNVALMEKQAREFLPEVVSMSDEAAAKELSDRLKDLAGRVRVLSGMDGLLALSTLEKAEIVVTAIVGMIGIRPTIAAIRAGKDIALANKETLVTAGHIIMPLAKEKNVAILPVDSEHSAIFQSLQGLSGDKETSVRRILLTASGGPFRGKTREELSHMTVEDALKHPNWAMGKKITVDSSTLVNKGLEVMEAGWLFSVKREQIKVLVHPQSILHSAVEFTDGAVIGQMGTPDMKLPIQYALTYPLRCPMREKPLDLCAVGSLTFEEPDTETFRGLKLAYEAMDTGGSMPTALNAANECAVALFLQKKLGFLEITELIERAMEAHAKEGVMQNPSLDDILKLEQNVYARVGREMARRKG